MFLNESESRIYYSSRIPHLKLTNRAEWRCPCPVHQGKDSNFSIKAQTGEAYCHSKCGRGFDAIELEQSIFGVGFIEAKRRVYELLGRPADESEALECEYNYVDEHGEVLYQVQRKKGKRFLQRRPDAYGNWVSGLGNVKRIPYNLQAVIEADRVWIVEGEKDVESLRSVGLVGSCNNGGAGNFKGELREWFTGKEVAILADNDEPGRAHALKVAKLLSGTAKSVKIVELPGLAEKADVSDYLAAGGAAAGILKAYSRATEWSESWEFGKDIPHENDKYIWTYERSIEDMGGYNRFWNLALMEGVPTPWKRLNRGMAGGFRKGGMYVLGGESGSGKSSLALQLAMHAMLSGYVPLIFSMEMNHADCFRRMCAISAEVDLLQMRDYQTGDIPADEKYAFMRSAIQKASFELSRCKMFVCSKSKVSPTYLEEEVSRMKAQEGVGFVVADHMQLMGSEKKGSQYERQTAISRDTKQVCMEVGLPFLVISQVSRDPNKQQFRELFRSDLRDSGAIAEDADGILLLYPDKDDAQRCLANGTLATGPVKNWLKKEKDRFGMDQVYLPLMHHKTTTRFTCEIPN